MPGPLFSFAAYLGALKSGDPTGWAGAALAVVAIFLPGLLLVAAALPHWQAIRGVRTARAVIVGINAAVVGILAAAFYDPVCTSAIAAPLDVALALAAFVLLTKGKAQPWLVVMLAAAAGATAARYHTG
jgi:chromate transporter